MNPTKAMQRIALIMSAMVLAACSEPAPNENAVAASASTANAPFLQAKVNLSLYAADGSLIYSDVNSSTSLKLKSGTPYDLNLDVSGAPAGTSLTLESSQIDVVSGASAAIPLQSGANQFTVPAAGDYTWKIVASAPGYTPLTKIYQASVQCPNPTFTANSLSASSITASAGTGSNLYNFSAAGVVAGANGMPPYLCAWDPTGVGIVDTAFRDCGQVLSNFYVNYVGPRSVGVIVKDACNIEYSVSNSVNLGYSEPSMPGNVFIFGQNSNATGSAVGDARIDGVTYLATNSGGHNIVLPNYGSGSFTIQASMNYKMPSSVDFGMKIEVKGLTDTIDMAAATGTIDATHAFISKVTYSTDQAGDSAPVSSLSGSSCTLSNQNATVKMVKGQPCASGTTGDNNKATVEVWGHYVCHGISNSGASIDISGDFDGMDDIVDNCVGGGGQGGGGIVPIGL